jgi:hypothetical protein
MAADVDPIPKETSVTTHIYEISVAGSLGPAAREAFAGLEVKAKPPTITIVSGDLDQVGLHALLQRVRALRLELLSVKQASA